MKVQGDLCFCGFYYEINGKRVQNVPENFDISDQLIYKLKGGMVSSVKFMVYPQVFFGGCKGDFY